MERPQEKPLLAQKSQVLDLSNYDVSLFEDLNEKESTIFIQCLHPMDTFGSPNEIMSCEPKTRAEITTTNYQKERSVLLQKIVPNWNKYYCITYKVGCYINFHQIRRV